MALSNVFAIPPCLSCCCICRNSYLHVETKGLGLGFSVKRKSRKARVFSSSCLGKKGSVTMRCRLNAIDTRIESAQTGTIAIEIPISCYQLIGVSDKAEKDAIVKSVMDLKRAEVEEGYTMDAVISRQDLLMDVRDKLLFEPEYAGNMREKIPPKCSLKIPWAWLPGALCLLQEVGEEERVLDIGRWVLQHPDGKPYIHDILLSMALAECAIAKAGFERNKVSQGFEALARAQCLLRSSMSLGKMPLLTLIEQSLEELAPACTLEILGMPHSPENAERRRGAIAALRELLRQGLDVETTCQVQDWHSFLSQALNRLMATEIVDLLSWDNLATTRKNKKSIESQNQRVVIDFNCFYVALTAHVALGISSKQTELINKSKIICECLIASEGIDLKFEESLCLFLLGQCTEAEVVEKLQQLELNLKTSGRNTVAGKEVSEVSGAKPSLDVWLKNNVLAIFPDTRDSSPSLVNYFAGEKKTLFSKKTIGAPQILPNGNKRSHSSAFASERRDFDETLSYRPASRHLGPAVKQLTSSDQQSPSISGKSSSGSNATASSAQLKRNVWVNHSKVWENWPGLGLPGLKNVVERITFVAVLGCIMFFTFNLSGMKSNKMRNTSKMISSQKNMEMSSVLWTSDSSCRYHAGHSCTKVNGVARKLQEFVTMVKMRCLNQLDSGYLKTVCFSDGLSKSMIVENRGVMPFEEAEALVKNWQAIKAEALGPDHQLTRLSEALDESMLAQWQALAEAAKSSACYWRFVLLQLTILHAEILSNEINGEMAEIEAVLEEAAELVDESQPKNPNYYSTYKIRYFLKRQDDGSWRFCKGDIQTPM